MKTLSIIFLAFVSVSSFALEYESKLKCEGNDCKEVNVFKGLKPKELALSDLSVGQCLIDLKTEKVSKVVELDAKSQKVVMLTEKEEYTLNRSVVFYNTKDFNRNLKKIPCEEVNGVLGKAEELNNCLKSAGKYSTKVFCIKPRMYN